MAEEGAVEVINSEIQQEMYIPVRTLGRGAFGEAVLYRKLEDNMLVVWKEVNLSRASDRERVDALKEIDILSLLNHTNIVTYFNHFIDGTSLFIEMEYCNGGTLHDKISSQNELFAEEIVIWYFFQICAAMAHIHENCIVHRDIKTMNIFLTKSGLVKLGDFGISKILDSEGMADSIVGTPYYMSPEILQGKKYNQKSDMWALGCVVYEVLTLKRVFEATNPLRLVSDIVRGEFEEIDARYTEDMNDIVNRLLSQEPEERPSVHEMLYMPLLATLGKEMEKKVWQLNASTRRARLVTGSSETVPVITSKTSEVFFWGAGKQTPQKLETFVHGNSALEVSAGHSHFGVVTVEKELFTWANAHGGKGMVGQLGHGDIASYRLPKRVDALYGLPMKQVACGEEFTVCISDDGVLYTFGSDYWGCIGCNNEKDEEVLLPYMVPFFADKPVEQVACGDCHVVALTRAKEVYSWGCGEHGRLGLGSEDDYALPEKVALSTSCKIKRVYCGPESTFLLTNTGRVLAFGNNDENQLALDVLHSLKKRSTKGSEHVPNTSVPMLVQSLNRYTIAIIASGRTHTAFIDVYGRLITVGSNKFGQLGVNDYQVHPSPCLVKGELVSKQIIAAACGEQFTVVATAENMVYSFGRGDNGRLGITPDNLEKVLNSRTIRRSARSMDSQSSMGDTGDDSVFSDRLRIEVDSSGGNEEADAGDNRPRNPLAESGDSGVGPSPRSPFPRTLGDSSLPPPWLQDELDQAEMISVESNSQGSKNSAPARGVYATSNESSVPVWLKKELQDAEYIPVDGHAVDDKKSPSSRTQDVVSPVGVQCVAERDSADASDTNCHIEPQNEVEKDLMQRILQLEEESQQLRKTIQDQVIQIKSLQHEKSTLVENQNKFWGLIDSWHKDCQKASQQTSLSPRQSHRKMPARPVPLESNGSVAGRASPDPNVKGGPPSQHVAGTTDDMWEV